MKKAATILAAGAIAAFGLAACGSSDDNNDDNTAVVGGASGASGPGGASGAGGAATGAQGGGETLKVSADPSGKFAFEQKSLKTKAGTVTVDFDNPAPLSHDVVIEDKSGQEVGKTDLIAQDQASFTVDLKPGTYTYFCSVPGHRDGGMEGTLTVQ